MFWGPRRASNSHTRFWKKSSTRCCFYQVNLLGNRLTLNLIVYLTWPWGWKNPCGLFPSLLVISHFVFVLKTGLIAFVHLFLCWCNVFLLVTELHCTTSIKHFSYGKKTNLLGGNIALNPRLLLVMTQPPFTTSVRLVRSDLGDSVL